MNEYKRILKTLAGNKQLPGIKLPKGKSLEVMPNNKLLVQTSKQVQLFDLLEKREVSLTSGTTVLKLSKALANDFLSKIDNGRKLHLNEIMLCIVDGYVTTVSGVKHLPNKIILLNKEMLDTESYIELSEVEVTGKHLAPTELILNSDDSFNLFEAGVSPLRIKTNRDDVYLQVVEVSKQPSYKVVVRLLDPKTNKYKIQSTHKVNIIFRDTTKLECEYLINHIYKLEANELEGKHFLTSFRKYIDTKKLTNVKEFYEALLKITPYKFLKSSSYSPEVNAAYIYSHIGQEIFRLYSMYLKNQLTEKQLDSMLPARTTSIKRVAN